MAQPGERGVRDGYHLPGLLPARQKRLWTIRQLGEATGVSIDTISRLERGQRRAYPTTIRKLAEALGVEPATLLGEERP